MGLFHIAFKNIKRNFHNYFLYFISMIFSIMIYFTFTSIQYNTQVQIVAGESVNFAAVFKATAIVVAIFVAIFIWYSNSFFIRKRKREVALYSLLGIRKAQIGALLLYENIVMGAAALMVGIFMGGLLSKLFIMILVRLMGFSSDITFMIPMKAVLDTTITFTLLFLITSLHGYTLIYRFKLIELFRAEKQGERAPKTSVILSIGAVLMIGFGYWIYSKVVSSFFIIILFVTLALTVMGTFLLFNSLMLLIIKLSKKNERSYYKGINMIGTSQLLYRIKVSARTLATIAVLSAATLTAMEVSTSFLYKQTVNLHDNYGFTYAYASNDKALDKEVEDVIAEYPMNQIINSVDMSFAKVSGQWPGISEPTQFYIISESMYNNIVNARGLQDKIKLQNDSDAVIFGQILNFTTQYDFIGKNITINDHKDKAVLKVSDFKKYSLANSGFMRWAVVVKDNIYHRFLTEDNLFRVKGYITENKKEGEELDKSLTELLTKKLSSSKGDTANFSSYYAQYRGGLTFSGLIMFISAFVGLLFLVATGSIIFFKQLSEANDDKSRYEILRNIGVTNKEIDASISKQILIVFALPLVIGIMHSLVATSVLTKLLRVSLTLPIIVTIAAYTVIYMVYYFLTVNSYINIIKRKV